jgi:hypothetical protein
VKFDIIESAEHVRVHAYGPFDARVAQDSVDETFALCEARGLNRIFIDGRGLTGEVTITDRYEFGTYLAAKIRKPLRIAFLVSPAHFQPTKTLENSATNRGAPVCTTVSESEAWEWLGLPAP